MKRKNTGAVADAPFYDGLFRRCYRLMAKVARSSGVPEQDVEDVIQEASLRLFSVYETLKTMEEPAVAAYVANTVRTVSINRHRDRPPEVPEENIEAPVGGAEETLIRLEELDSLKRAFRSLPPEEMNMIYEKYALGLSAAEIGALHGGLTEGVVRVRLFRIRKKLYGIIRKGEDGHEN